MRVLIDKYTLQGNAHLVLEETKGLRLTSFIELLSAESGVKDVTFTEGRFRRSTLKGCSLLVIPTRKVEMLEEEVDAVEEYMLDSGSVLLMSNHEPHHTIDTVIGERFGVQFEGTGFSTKGSFTSLCGDCLAAHPIVTGAPEEDPVREIVISTTCSILAEGCEDIAFLADTMHDQTQGQSTKRKRFAVSRQLSSGGRIVAMANSGFIGTKGTKIPGNGLIDEGDNSLFLQRTVRWLLER